MFVMRMGASMIVALLLFRRGNLGGFLGSMKGYRAEYSLDSFGLAFLGGGGAILALVFLGEAVAGGRGFS